MTLLLAHPEAEDLGRFVEGTLDENERKAIVAHIADCDECRMAVVDAAEFVEPAVVHSERRWWVAAAATIAIAIAGSGTYIWHAHAQHDPLEPMIKASARLSSPIEARLSGFNWVAARRTMRGSSETDPERLLLEVEAYEVLKRHGDDPRMQHAKGVARLLTAQTKLAETMEQLGDGAIAERKDAVEAARREFVVEQNDAIALLQSAAVRVPDNASYQTDLAAALIETRELANLNRAVNACDQALQIDRRSPEALFNRAVALRSLPDAKKAIAAFNLYLTVDPSSPWANEARRSIEGLQQGP